MKLQSILAASFLSLFSLSSCQKGDNFVPLEPSKQVETRDTPSFFNTNLEDALLKANTKDQVDSSEYKDKIDLLYQEFMQDMNFDEGVTSTKKAKELVDWINNRVGSQYIDSVESKQQPRPSDNDVFYLTDAIDSFFDEDQRFDCVSMNAFYAVLGEKVGLSVHTYAIGNHVVSGIKVDVNNDSIFYIDPSFGLFSSGVTNISIMQEKPLEEINILAETYKTQALSDCSKSDQKKVLEQIEILSTLEIISMNDPTYSSTQGLCHFTATQNYLSEGSDEKATEHKSFATHYFKKAKEGGLLVADSYLEKLDESF